MCWHEICLPKVSFVLVSPLQDIGKGPLPGKPSDATAACKPCPKQAACPKPPPATCPPCAVAAAVEEDTEAAAHAQQQQQQEQQQEQQVPGASVDTEEAWRPHSVLESWAERLTVPWGPLLTQQEAQRGLAYYGSGGRLQAVAARLLAGKPIKVRRAHAACGEAFPTERE